MTSDSSTGWIFLVGIAIAGAIRLMAGSFDRERIREYIESGGGKVLDIEWSPFGPGWFGSNERIYIVRYQNRHGEIHSSTCKTSAGSGVYWTGHAPPSGGVELAEDNGPNAVEPATPAEPIACLECGTRIPPNQTRCPHCGWSYQQN